MAKKLQLIGGFPSGENTDAVSYSTAQTLTDEQKAQARENIGAVSEEDLERFKSDSNDDAEFQKTVTGSCLLITDCAGGAFKGVSIYGATYQAANPTEEKPQALEPIGKHGEIHLRVSNKNLINRPYVTTNTTTVKGGVTYTVNEDGSITATGINTSGITWGADFVINNNNIGHMLICGGDLGECVSAQDCFVQHYLDRTNISILYGVPMGQEIDVTVYPQVEFNDEVTSFESPVEAQYVTIATPNGLRGVPVVNNGTYVDRGGTQWVCDEIDLTHGVYIQRIGQIDSYAGESIDTPYISSMGSLVTGATVQYVMDDPVETPLDTKTIDSFKRLTMHTPNTSVYVTFDAREYNYTSPRSTVCMRVDYSPIAKNVLSEDYIEAIEDAVDEAMAFDPVPYGLPILYLYGDVSNMSKDDAAVLSYVYGDLSGTCTVKWQGSSSLMWAKKNYTIDFDQEFEIVEGWGAQKKYCFKANFIDHSHARNVVNAKLWGQIVKSRNKPNEALNELPNAGAIDGFPCVVMLNDKFHGLYTWNIPKDGWMFGMGAGTHEAIVCADKSAGDPCGFKSATATFTDFSLEYASDEDDTDWILSSLNTLIDAVVNSDGTDLDTVIAQYLDWDSAIDYFIFTVLVGGTDMYRKNYILATYDGVKWFFSAYDMDTTYGLNWKGNGFNNTTCYPFMTQYNHRVMELVQTYKKDAVKARYKELRDTILSEDNLYMMFTNWAAAISLPVMVEDVRKWPTIPSSAISNVAQILNWYRMRVNFVDKDIEKL